MAEVDTKMEIGWGLLNLTSAPLILTNHNNPIFTREHRPRMTRPREGPDHFLYYCKGLEFVM